MGDRHGYSSIYPRPRSPIYNPGRTSLPTSVGYSGYMGGYGDPIYPASRRDIPSHPRSSGERLTITGPTTTTKYKVIPASNDITRSSSLRTDSRSRSATVDSSGRPLSISQAPRLRPVIHAGAGRPQSPISSPYRASDDGAYLVPASSHHHRGHQRGVHSIDSSAKYQANSRNVDHLRIGSGRENAVYASSRGRPYSNALVTASDDYTDPGYSFTNSRELAQYDLDHKRHLRHRRESSESRQRPASIMSTTDLRANSFDARERGPPPSTRGRDKVSTTRATLDIPVRSRADMGYESDSRLRKTRPTSMYEQRDPPRSHREYGFRETEPRERAPREKSHHHSRHDDEDRSRNNEKHSERKEHRSRDSLATTLGLAAASAFGLGAAAQSNKEVDRDERDESSRRARDERDEPSRRVRDERDERDELSRKTRDDSDEERRRRRRAEDREPISVDTGNRNPREKGYTREGDRDSPPRERESFSSRDGEYKHDSKDKHGSLSSQSPPREKRSSPPIPKDGRSRHDTATTVDHPREETSKNRSRSHSGSTSDLSSSERDRRSRKKHDKSIEEAATPTTPSAAFNPKNAMDLRALKEQLNRQEEPREAKRSSIASMAVAGVAAAATTGAAMSIPSRDKNYSPQEDDRGRRNLIDETQPPKELREPQHQIRVVSPPRETQIAKTEDKPVKGILRAPREKFPEDPTHIREGVAPLKDAKNDGVPPNARWTKISRTMVNPEALEAGKERYEEDPDFVTVLRVLSKDEIQAYATITEAIRAKREDEREKIEKERQRQRRTERRERHERHKREGRAHQRSSRHRKEDYSESDTTEDEDRDNDHVRAIEAPEPPRPRRIAFEDHALMSGGLGDLKENPNAPGTYTGYTRAPPPPQSLAR